MEIIKSNIKFNVNLYQNEGIQNMPNGQYYNN